MQSRDYILSVRRSTLFLKQNVENKEFNTFHVHQTNIQKFHAFLVLIECLYFPTPGHGLSLWHHFPALAPNLYLPVLVPNFYLLALAPICIYQPWSPICIYRHWPPNCIYQPWLPICIHRHWSTILLPFQGLSLHIPTLSLQFIFVFTVLA